MIEEIEGDLLQWLRGFYAVAEQGSVTQATDLMGREQPTITRHIKCLEKQLGVMLFDRSTGTMKLTAEGKALRDQGDQPLRLLAGDPGRIQQGAAGVPGENRHRRDSTPSSIIFSPPTSPVFRRRTPASVSTSRGAF